MVCGVARRSHTKLREGVMIRTRSAQVIAALAASLALAFFAAVSTSSHETDEQDDAQAPGGGPGPDLSKPIALPLTLSAFEIVLGLNAAQPDEWQGEVEVSQGRVVDLVIVRSGPASKVQGSRFTLQKAAAKNAAKQAKNQAKNKKKQAKKQAKN